MVYKKYIMKLKSSNFIEVLFNPMIIAIIIFDFQIK